MAQREGLPQTCSDPNDREDLLLEILKTGLPKPSVPGCEKSIIVVGAGISGLIGKYYVSILDFVAQQAFWNWNWNCSFWIWICLINIKTLTVFLAAKLLEDAGHQVTIFEASSRVGGRIFTYRNLEENWQFELGPMRIPRTHALTRELVSSFEK